MSQIMTTQAQERGLDIRVQSAGIEASSYVLNSSLLADTMKAMQSLRYKPGPHTPTQITEKMINGVDLVLCFSKRYLEPVQELANHPIPEICLAHEFGGTDFEVANIQGMYRTNWMLNKLPFSWDIALNHVDRRDPKARARLHLHTVRQIDKLSTACLDRLAVMLQPF